MIQKPENPNLYR